jgi:glycine betaine/proline transport system substrate-binding protein
MKRVLILLLVLTSLFLGACSERENTANEPAPAKKVTLAYVEWVAEVASTNVMKVVLEELGYQVKILPVSAAAMWQSLASQDADGMTSAWLPTTHGHYLDQVKDKVENLGPNLVGTRIGLVVPQYVSIDSITEIKAHADKFDGKIIGIDPGAGIMSLTEQAMADYALNDLKLMEGSGATMTATLADEIKHNSWVVVTGWTPHWMFARWDLKYLEDPKGIYGGEETINTIVRPGLKEEMPEVYAVLDNFHWTPAQCEALIAANQEDGADPYANARQWVENNRDLVTSWLPK